MADALAAIVVSVQRLDMIPGLGVMRAYANTLDEDEKRVVYEDIAVFEQAQNRYLRDLRKEQDHGPAPRPQYPGTPRPRSGSAREDATRSKRASTSDAVSP